MFRAAGTITRSRKYYGQTSATGAYETDHLFSIEDIIGDTVTLLLFCVGYACIQRNALQLVRDVAMEIWISFREGTIWPSVPGAKWRLLITQDHVAESKLIAEWFYPKELKDVIADLRANGDLNDDVLARINNTSISLIAFWIFVVTFYWFTLESQDYFIWAFCVSALIAMIIIIKEIQDSCTRILVYRKGVFKKAKIIKFLYHLRNPTVKIKIKDIESSQIITLGPFKATKDFKHNFPKFGEEIHYYSAGAKKSQNMPDYEPIKKQYCLSLSQLKGNQP